MTKAAAETVREKKLAKRAEIHELRTELLQERRHWKSDKRRSTDFLGTEEEEKDAGDKAK